MKQKAQLVVKRYIQIQGKDFDEIYASVVWLKSMQIIIAIVMALEMHIWQVYFTFAYFNSMLKHTVYIRPSLDFQRKRERFFILRKYCMASCKAVTTSGTS